MKKLVLIMICTLTMILFIALNYLLWDRENKINADYSKNASISALSREIKNLDSMNTSYMEKISKLESNIKALEGTNKELQQEKEKGQAVLNHKNDIIHQLKQGADTSAMESVIKNWADFIDKGQYDTAYQLQVNPISNQPYGTLEEFTNYYKSYIKNIKVTSIQLMIQDVLEEKRGDLLFKVTFDITKVPNSMKTIFEEGANDKLFTIIFSREKNAWLIGDIQ